MRRVARQLARVIEFSTTENNNEFNKERKQRPGSITDCANARVYYTRGPDIITNVTRAKNPCSRGAAQAARQCTVVIEATAS